MTPHSTLLMILLHADMHAHVVTKYVHVPETSVKSIFSHNAWKLFKTIVTGCNYTLAVDSLLESWFNLELVQNQWSEGWTKLKSGWTKPLVWFEFKTSLPWFGTKPQQHYLMLGDLGLPLQSLDEYDEKQDFYKLGLPLALESNQMGK